MSSEMREPDAMKFQDAYRAWDNAEGKEGGLPSFVDRVNSLLAARDEQWRTLLARTEAGAPHHPLAICPTCKDYYEVCECTPDAAPVADGAVDSRAAFERWAKPQGYRLHIRDIPGSPRLGQYGDDSTQAAWEAWTASRTTHPQDASGDAEKDAEIARLNAIINSPQSDDFLRAVSTEAEHQRQRWGSEHDAGKAPADWFWLVGYLGGKALHSHATGDTAKAEHHIITTAAACANWHRAMFGRTDMRPGIDGLTAMQAKEAK